MKRLWIIGAFLLATVVMSSPTSIPVAEAHQPYCEDHDVTLTSPFHVDDPTVSTAFYGTLFPEDDVDYVAFRGEAGQRILLGITIPQIEGQEDFAPTFALFGPGLGETDLTLLPDYVQPPRDASFEIFAAGDDEPESFYEPFSGTSYWNRQETRITLPENGHYTVAVWHDEGAYGRYVVVVGDREIIGGDLSCLTGLDEYFTPVDAIVEMMHEGESHDHGDSTHGDDHGHDESHGDEHEDPHHQDDHHH